MFKINDDLSIYVTRGDAVAFNLSASNDKGETYLFKAGDIVRIKITEKKACEEVVFQKSFTVETDTETVEISLDGTETKIGEVISKPTDYWYEIELNPFTYPHTIIGYDDENGAKIFKLFPEGNDVEPTEPEDIPVVDTELDLSSERPVQNQAIAYAITNLVNEVNTTVENTLNDVEEMVDDVMEELKNVPNIDNMKHLQEQIDEHKEATDPHNIESGLVKKEIAEDVAEDDKVLVVVDGEIKKTNVDNIGVREIEGSNTITNTKVLTDEWQAMRGLDNRYRGVTYGNGKYVCVGVGGLSCYSTDGLTWTAMSGLNNTHEYYASTYGDDRFVCVGYNGKSYYSTDGLTWTAMSGLNTTKCYYGATYGDDRFVCVGESGSAYYSTDGTTWTAMSGLDTSVNYGAVTYGNNRFVCVGETGKSYYSVDGTTWIIMRGLNTSIQHLGIAYGNNRFVCVGVGGSSYYSTDGLTWTAMSGLDASAVYYGATYGDDRFVCVGVGGSSYYSTDGETWQVMTGLDTSKIYYDVTYGTEFVCVGDSVSSHYVYETETKTETLQGTLQVAGTLLLTKLYAGQTTVTISDTSITQDSTFDIYTDVYGVNPKKVTVDTGSITLEFKPQETDVNIKVVVK